MDAYLFCLLYFVARLIDRRGIFIKRFGFLPAYDQAAEAFDWKFEALGRRDRTFRRYSDGSWDELHCPLADPENHRKACVSASRDPNREVTRTVKLLYTKFNHHPRLYGENYGWWIDSDSVILQLDVMNAFDAEFAKYNPHVKNPPLTWDG